MQAAHPETRRKREAAILKKARFDRASGFGFQGARFGEGGAFDA